MTTYKLPDDGADDPAEGTTRAPDNRATYMRRSLSRTRRVGANLGPDATAADEDPVSGWLVIIKGPGQGEVVTLGEGVHTVGRKPDNRVQIDYGDDSISGVDHFRVIYDPKAVAFHAVHGTGKNLIEIDGQTVIDRASLQPSSHIQVGETTLRFVPFCTAEFDWSKLGK